MPQPAGESAQKPDIRGRIVAYAPQKSLLAPLSTRLIDAVVHSPDACKRRETGDERVGLTTTESAGILLGFLSTGTVD